MAAHHAQIGRGAEHADGWRAGLLSERTAPRPTITRTYLAWLDNASAPQGWRLIHDSDRSRPARLMYGTLSELIIPLTRANLDGYGVFITLNRCDLQGQSTQNITSTRAAMVDLDGAPLPDRGGDAHMLVWTSPPRDGEHPRAHMYYRTDDTLTLAAFRHVQLGLAQAFNGDTSLTDLPRVVRVPGFMHMKRPDEPFMVTVGHCDMNAAPLSVHELAMAYPSVQEALSAAERRRAEATSRRASYTPPADAGAFLQRLPAWFSDRAARITTTGRHELLIATASQMLDNALTEPQATHELLRLRDLLPPRSDGSLPPDSEVRDVTRWVYATLQPREPWSVTQKSVIPSRTAQRDDGSPSLPDVRTSALPTESRAHIVAQIPSVPHGTNPLMGNMCAIRARETVRESLASVTTNLEIRASNHTHDRGEGNP